MRFWFDREASDTSRGRSERVLFGGGFAGIGVLRGAACRLEGFLAAGVTPAAAARGVLDAGAARPLRCWTVALLAALFDAGRGSEALSSTDDPTMA